MTKSRSDTLVDERNPADTGWQIAGWVGGILVVLGYLISVLTGTPDIFNSMNVIGCVMMVPSTIHFRAYFATFLNISFGTIGLIGLLT